MIQKITPELKEKLGLEAAEGALVSDVTEGGPADEAGIQRGDVIVSFRGEKIDEMEDLPYLVASTPVGTTAPLEVIRDGKRKEITVKIGELEEEQARTGSAEPSGPELGMTLKEITPQLARQFKLSQSNGLVVVGVEANSPAADAGIRPGDIIVEVEREPVNDMQTFRRIIRGADPGDTILFLVNRRGSTLFLTLETEEE
jgi:serine protease Do